MVTVKKLIYNVKTGKKTIKEVDRSTLKIDPSPKLEGVNLSQVAKLLEYAKSKGWI